MARYGREFGGGYREGGWGGPYDRFRYGGGGPPGWGGYPGGGRGQGWGGPPRGGYGGDFHGAYGGGYGGEFRGGWSAGAERGGRTGEPMGQDDGAADRVRAADIMTANPEAVTPDTSLAEVAKRMLSLDVGIIPVVDTEDDYHLQGVITDRDIAIRAAAKAVDMKKEKVADYMTTNVQTVRENDHVRDVFTVMKRARVRRVPVIDDEGKLVGIIAQADLAVTYAGLDLQRETEVEEVIEKISEPARPKWGGRDIAPAARRKYVVGGPVYDRDHRDDHDWGDRLRDGWNRLRREAHQMVYRGPRQGGW